ncbi:glycoside hydrolase family 1 protein [Phenylobacterium soli]|uniref:Glycoside hydrolase family 1 protein n=2 Tax=Phenylobacterium soli TaxID=2170551 RepID=A0A328AEM3_9CAUL|nr:glycoside hydrolase family 1 protein [Phenylobacterium soli]
MDRRTLMGAAAALSAGTGSARATAHERRRPVPPGFLWGTAISAHQSEGNNTNSDTWLLENLTPTVYKDRSGDACDSYHRFAEDIALNAALGFNCYRFGIEWARIEPSPGKFSIAELDHYARVLEACHAHGQTPVVTFNHFSAPLWFSVRGGWEQADAPDLFARYGAKVTERLGHLMGMATTFNEANVQLLVQVMAPAAPSSPLRAQMLAAARRATGSERFTALAYADPEISQPLLLEAHRKAYLAMKAARSGLPVGISLTTQAIEPVGPGSIAPAMEAKLYGGWVEMAKSHSDFTGVQTYTRFRFDAHGMVAPPAGAELTAAGYEFYPQALAETIRWAHRAIGKPIYVTESGIGTDDDRRRIDYIDQALDGVRACLDEGIPVHSYLYWSLLDNFEWAQGFSKHFGLVAVDLETFRRTPKPSAYHLGAIAKAGRA